MKLIYHASAMTLVFLAASCARVSVDPIEVKTIRIEHEINLHVDQKLDEYFAYQQRAATQPAATQPTAHATPKE